MILTCIFIGIAIVAVIAAIVEVTDYVIRKRDKRKARKQDYKSRILQIQDKSRREKK